MLNEEKIIEELEKGNQDGFALLYEKYSKGVYAVILGIVHNRDVADDLLQITFMKLFKNIKLYKKYKGTFYNFVCAIGKNTALDYLKKVKVKINEDGEEKVVNREVTFDDGLMNLIGLHENVVKTIEIDELMKELKNAVGELAESQQIAIRLSCERAFSYRGAAKIMGISEGAFKSLLYRARQTLIEKISDKYPELFKEISTRKHVVRMIVMLIVGLTALTGLVYATYMICNEIWSKKTFTLSELRTEVSHDASIISKDEALERMNFYLDVLGEEKANIDELKLIKDYQVYKVCWMIDRDDAIMRIDSANGELVRYRSIDGNNILERISMKELYKKLEFPEDYELFEENSVNGFNIIKYAKRYNNIYNLFESVSLNIKDNNLVTITFSNYDYEDTEILVSKEDALRIAKENNIKVDTIELSIEKINDLENDSNRNKNYETFEENDIDSWRLFTTGIKVKKVWKIIGGIENILIDVKTGEIIYNK